MERKTDLKKAKASARRGFFWGVIILEAIVLGISWFAASSGLPTDFTVMFVLIVPLVCWIWYIMVLRDIKHTHCPACGTKHCYDTDVSYEETEENVSGGRRVATVSFECLCECGHAHCFTRKFTVARTTERGIRYYNPESEIRKLFEQKFS